MDQRAPSLRLSQLTGDRIDLAFPLAKSSCVGLTLLAWRRWAKTTLRQADKGILTVENLTGVLMGLSAYRLYDDLLEGRTLELGPVMLADLVGGTQIADALIEGAERLALRERCSSLHSLLPGQLQASADATLMARFHRAGHRQDGVRLCKRFTAAD